MTAIRYSNIRKETKKRPSRLAIVFTHSRDEKKRIKQALFFAGFRSEYVPTGRKKAKNGSHILAFRIPSAPVAIKLFKKALPDNHEAYASMKNVNISAFINWLIANSRKAKRNGSTAETVPEKEERTAARIVEKLRKSAYSEKLAIYKESILDTWIENGQIERLSCEIERGKLNEGSVTGRELAAKRKKKSGSLRSNKEVVY
jgi:hypothetical protein